MRITVNNLQKRISIPPGVLLKIKKAVRLTVVSQGTARNGEINIYLVGGAKIRGLNKRYLKKNSPTDVIAFDLSAKDTLADIFICVDTALSNAKIFKTTAFAELYLYAVHGALHILGYDDKGIKQRNLMQAKAERILNGYAHT